MAEPQTYWMLEHLYLNRDGRPRYYWNGTPDGGYTLTTNAFKAMRWHTRQDARRARGMIPYEPYRKHFRVAEHVFTGSHCRKMSWLDKLKVWLTP